MNRPAVDVVVPFTGSRHERRAALERLVGLEVRPGDTLVLVDNSPRGPTEDRPSREPGGAEAIVGVLRAGERHTPGYARNRGSARGRADWIVFLDADTEPAPDLLDRYFDPPPALRTALIGGGIRDQPVPADAPRAARYSFLRGAMSQEDSFRFGDWSYPKSANVACRRDAYEAVGGFREDMRAAEDADLAYRLRAASWKIERREAAMVVHFSRVTVRGLLKQKALWGAGGAGLDRLHPGAAPPRHRLRLLGWAARTAGRGLLSASRARSRDQALWAVLEPLEAVAFEFGRSLPNERPLTAMAWWRAARRLRAPRGVRRL